MRAIALLLLLTTATTTFAMERYSVVKISGFDKSAEYRLLNSEELKAVHAELREESKHFPRAMMAAKQEWGKDETKKRQRFPMLSKRSLRVMKTYTKREDAEKKMLSYEPEEETPVRRKKGESDRKAEAAAEKAALKQTAVDMVTSKISDLIAAKAAASKPAADPPAPAVEK